MMRPRPLARRCGRQRPTRRTCGTRRSSTAAVTDALVTPAAGPGGGPPPLSTTMSIPPNASTVAVDEALEIGGLREVARHGERADPCRLALDDLGSAGEHRDARAFGGESLGDREAHALRGAEHDRAPSVKSEVHGARSVPGRTVQDRAEEGRGQVFHVPPVPPSRVLRRGRWNVEDLTPATAQSLSRRARRRRREQPPRTPSASSSRRPSASASRPPRPRRRRA